MKESIAEITPTVSRKIIDANKKQGVAIIYAPKVKQNQEELLGHVKLVYNSLDELLAKIYSDEVSTREVKSNDIDSLINKTFLAKKQ